MLDGKTGRLLWKTPLPPKTAHLVNLIISPNRNLLCAALPDKLELYDVKTGERYWSQASWRDSFIVGAQFSVDGQTLKVRTKQGRQIWDVRTGGFIAG
jgi:hypothetical protein